MGKFGCIAPESKLIADCALGLMFIEHGTGVNWEFRESGHYLNLVSRLILSGGFEVLLDEHRRVTGYVAIAKLSERADMLMLRHGVKALDSAFLVDHGQAWLLDCQIRFGRVRDVISKIATNLITEGIDDIRYFRYKQRNRLVKSVDQISIRRLSGRNPPSSLKLRSLREVGVESLLGHDGRLMEPLEHFRRIGEIFRFVVQTEFFSRLLLRTTLQRIAIPVQLQQFTVLRSGAGTAVGYLSWMWRERSSADVESLVPDSLEDWNDGRELYFVDMVAAEGSTELLFDQIRGGLFPNVPSAYSIVTEPNGARKWLNRNRSEFGEADCSVANKLVYDSNVAF